jgi:diketogulonate reductase-like aldo/keto reductase
MMQKDDVLAIPRSTNLYRLRENLIVFDFELSAHEMEIIEAWRLENIRVVGAQAGAVWD